MVATPSKAATDSSISAFGTARSTVEGAPLTPEELRKIHAYWRACNYLAVGMIYLQEHPLLREPLKLEHVKHRLLGHWGSSPGISFLYTIRYAHEHGIDMPGILNWKMPGAPAGTAPSHDDAPY